MATSEPVTKNIPGGGTFTYIIVGTEKIPAAQDRAYRAIFAKMNKDSDEELEFFDQCRARIASR